MTKERASYFHRKAQHERERAKSAPTPTTRELHRQLADLYDARATELEQAFSDAERT